MTERGRLERLQGASHDFRMGDHAAVIAALESQEAQAALEPDADDIGPLGHTLLLASRALILEREGQPPEDTALPAKATTLGTVLHLHCRVASRYRVPRQCRGHRCRPAGLPVFLRLRAATLRPPHEGRTPTNIFFRERPEILTQMGARDDDRDDHEAVRPDRGPEGLA